MGATLTSDELLTLLTAVANPHRLRIVAELRDGRVHVSELARRLGMSRPLLYMHLDKLEKAGLVAGQLELSGDGKAMKYFELDAVRPPSECRDDHHGAARRRRGRGRRESPRD